MSFSINKKIGYFLPFEKQNLLLSKDYENIIYDMFFKDDFIDYTNNNLLVKNDNQNLLSKLQIKNWIKTQQILTVSNFIQQIFNYDDFKGFLFLTPDIYKNHHFNDLIDYYENNQNMDYKIQYLNQSIYPNCNYICLKNFKVDESLNNLENLKLVDNQIVKGTILTSTDLHDMLFYTHSQNKDSFELLKEFNTENEKFFHYNIDYNIYIILKINKVLKEDISYLDFISHLEPAIITSWS